MSGGSFILDGALLILDLLPWGSFDPGRMVGRLWGGVGEEGGGAPSAGRPTLSGSGLKILPHLFPHLPHLPHLFLPSFLDPWSPSSPTFSQFL